MTDACTDAITSNNDASLKKVTANLILEKGLLIGRRLAKVEAFLLTVLFILGKK